MINSKFIQGLKKDYDDHNSERRQIISLSNVILNNSKRAIFSIHRSDMEKAEQSLKEMEDAVLHLEKKFGFNRLIQEGAYKAGIEEFVEAKLLYLVNQGKKIDKIGKMKIDNESYLGGICDLTGELVRQAVNKAAAGKFKDVEKTKEMINLIMAELVQFDMTGYLRTKYDQARGNLKKIEQIIYEINIRR